MGTLMSIVFDLKIENEQLRMTLEKLLTDNFDNFTNNIRPSDYLEIRLEKKKY